jgi:excisionase family DNA binding protein
MGERDHHPPVAVTISQACRLLSVGRTHLYELLKAHEIDSYHEGRARRVPYESIIAYATRRVRAEGRPVLAAPQARVAGAGLQGD